MKRLIRIISLCMAVVLTASCVRLDNFAITRSSLDSIHPSGLRGIKLSMNLEISNDGPGLSISGATGTLFATDRAIGSFSIEPVTVAPRQTAWIRLNCSIRLDDGISLLEIIPMMRSADMSDLSVSYEARLKTGIFRKTVRQEKVSLSSFINR